MFEDRYLGLLYRIGGAPVHLKAGLVTLKAWEGLDGIKTLVVHILLCFAYVAWLLIMDAFNLRKYEYGIICLEVENERVYTKHSSIEQIVSYLITIPLPPGLFVSQGNCVPGRSFHNFRTLGLRTFPSNVKLVD